MKVSGCPQPAKNGKERKGKTKMVGENEMYLIMLEYSTIIFKTW